MLPPLKTSTTTPSAACAMGVPHILSSSPPLSQLGSLLQRWIYFLTPHDKPFHRRPVTVHQFTAMKKIFLNVIPPVSQVVRQRDQRRCFITGSASQDGTDPVWMFPLYFAYVFHNPKPFTIRAIYKVICSLQLIISALPLSSHLLLPKAHNSLRTSSPRYIFRGHCAIVEPPAEVLRRYKSSGPSFRVTRRWEEERFRYREMLKFDDHLVSTVKAVIDSRCAYINVDTETVVERQAELAKTSRK
ncbi:uncharacterized protein BT62DRAFT_1014157 [Guyanagaster necrorhizus]|uniref:Uncharacterized protein n=1 Tax=Guyanagaster necrorhizus TaxID=856835 RepID=A0A9P7VE92_9AGAR|nr:uncharacterized protein BT62DRAFT_1014157 [Guyanagaster necrorhizus MCA 3950]KAG7439303.1 hypothetical protein BT62DRAFT_1014157 [Guyanagaster necrorhizus MCA 3950]